MESVVALVDPRSPWCFQGVRWLRALERLGAIELDWGIFSLEVINLKPHEDAAAFEGHYGPALRTASLLRTTFGTKVMGDFLTRLGELMWVAPVPDDYASDELMYAKATGEDTERYRIDHRSIAELTEHALVSLELDQSLMSEAMRDQQTWDDVVRQTRRWAESRSVFGVPSLVFDGGEGPAVFGPVILDLPSDDGCLKLWEDVRWLVESGYFFELKKSRDPSQLRVNLPNSNDRTALRVDLLREARHRVKKPGDELEGHGVDWAIAHIVAARAAAKQQLS